MTCSTAAPTQYSLGTQTFDGLGRRRSIDVGGRITRFTYTPGQPAPATTHLADGKQVNFTYEPALEHQLLSICPVEEPASHFTYDKKLAVIATADGPLGTLRTRYTPSGKPSSDTWTVDDKDHTTRWRYSLKGLLLGFVDASGADRQQQYDQCGRLVQVVVDNVTITITYDGFSRPRLLNTTDNASGNQLLQALTYDHCGREHTRSFTTTVAGSTSARLQTLNYNDLDQLTERHWQDAERQGMETFAYDTRGRLITYTATPEVAPEDPFGGRIIAQTFILNALDGYEQVTTTYADKRQDIAHYSYNNPKDPAQVSAISHSHSSWPALIELSYDACGRVSADSLGRRMTWDAQDRLTRVDYHGKSCAYGYDPSGNLSDRTLDGRLSRSFFSGSQITHEQTGDETLLHLRSETNLFALNRITAGLYQTTLLGQDAQGSVRVEADNQVRSRHYSAHGIEPENPANSPFGYTGERREPLTGWYIAAGYRPYDPLLMMFLSPDSESPFGRGGLNAYAYCAGDPVNRIDPDGHDWKSWFISGIGIALGVLATAMTLGSFAPALLPATAALLSSGVGSAITVTAATVSANITISTALTLASATLTATSLATGIASAILDGLKKDEMAVDTLGIVSLLTGIVGGIQGAAPKPGAKLSAWIRRSAGRALKKLNKRVPLFRDESRIAGARIGNTDFFAPTRSGPAPAPPDLSYPSVADLEALTPELPRVQPSTSGASARLTAPPTRSSSVTQESEALLTSGPGTNESTRHTANPARSRTNSNRAAPEPQPSPSRSSTSGSPPLNSTITVWSPSQRQFVQVTKL
ncbi:RHS repeat-associated core domain-containing protein [Pseudomonas sp. NUPR-001]|uniref:RHS repeat-associated core domain-containing protein n=1 Tax=Pseudomonas sp. NUPR-001 TaxID=3416058 RepID=UPI003F9806F9